MSIFDDYRRGLETLLEQLAARGGRGADAPYADVLTLQGRMLDALRSAELFGDTESRRSERAQILDVLNRLALKHLDVSFNALCGPTSSTPSAGTPAGTTTTASGERSIAIGGNAQGNTFITGNGNVVGNGNTVHQGGLPSEAQSSSETSGLSRALRMAHRALAILEEQAAGYTTLSIPVHLQIELEEQREKVRALEERCRET